MSQQQQAQQSEVERHLYNLGKYQREVATWVWLSIFLFWLVFPLVFLIWRKVQYLIELNKLSRIVKDYDLERAFLFQVIGAIITTVAFFAGWIIFIIGYDALERWGRRYAQQYQSKNMDEFVKGTRTIKIGLILIPLFIGLFIIPVGMARAGDALLNEFGGHPRSIHVKTPQQASQTESQPQVQEVEGYRPKFCASCGNPVENGLKFCKVCGTPL